MTWTKNSIICCKPLCLINLQHCAVSIIIAWFLSGFSQRIKPREISNVTMTTCDYFIKKLFRTSHRFQKTKVEKTTTTSREMLLPNSISTPQVYFPLRPLTTVLSLPSQSNAFAIWASSFGILPIQHCHRILSKEHSTPSQMQSDWNRDTNSSLNPNYWFDWGSMHAGDKGQMKNLLT
jgi:hypothetical protein